MGHSAASGAQRVVAKLPTRNFELVDLIESLAVTDSKGSISPDAKSIPQC